MIQFTELLWSSVLKNEVFIIVLDSLKSESIKFIKKGSISFFYPLSRIDLPCQKQCLRIRNWRASTMERLFIGFIEQFALPLWDLLNNLPCHCWEQETGLGDV